MLCKQKMHTVIKWDEPHMTLLKKKGWWTLELQNIKMYYSAFILKSVDCCKTNKQTKISDL